MEHNDSQQQQEHFGNSCGLVWRGKKEENNIVKYVERSLGPGASCLLHAEILGQRVYHLEANSRGCLRDKIHTL